MRLDGFGLFVKDMSTMISFYKDVLGFDIKEGEDTSLVRRFTVTLISLTIALQLEKEMAYIADHLFL